MIGLFISAAPRYPRMERAVCWCGEFTIHETSARRDSYRYGLAKAGVAMAFSDTVEKLQETGSRMMGIEGAEWTAGNGGGCRNASGQ